MRVSEYEQRIDNIEADATLTRAEKDYGLEILADEMDTALWQGHARVAAMAAAQRARSLISGCDYDRLQTQEGLVAKGRISFGRSTR